MAKQVEFEYKLRGRGNKGKSKKVVKWVADNVADAVQKITELIGSEEKASPVILEALNDYLAISAIKAAGLDLEGVVSKFAADIVKRHKMAGLTISEEDAVAKARELLTAAKAA